MSPVIGTAVLELVAETRQFKREVAQAKADIQSFSQASQQASAQSASASDRNTQAILAEKQATQAAAASQAEIIALTKARAAVTVAHTEALAVDASMARSNAAAQGQVAVGGTAAAKALLAEMQAARASAAGLAQSTLAANANAAANTKAAAQGARAAAQLFGIGTASRAMATLMTGGTAALTGMVAALGPLIIGSFVIGGVLKGLEAIGGAWRKMGEEARQAKEKTEDAIKHLEGLAEARRIAGLGGEDRVALDASKLERANIGAVIANLERQLATPTGDAEFDRAFQNQTNKRLEGLRATHASLNAVIREQEEFNRLTAFQAQVQSRLAGAQADAGAREQVRRGLEIAAETAARRAKEATAAAAEGIANAQRAIAPGIFTDVGRGLAEIARTREQIDAVAFALPFETGAKKAQEMALEIIKLQAHLQALEAAMPASLKEALDPKSVGFRAAPTQTDFLKSNAPPAAPIQATGVTAQLDPTVYERVLALLNEMSPAAQRLQAGLVSVAEAGIDAFASFAVGAGGSFREFVDGALKQLGRLLVKLAIFEGLSFLFPGSKIVGKLTGKIPGLAGGGYLGAGQAAIVGEKGPELFVPNRSGMVVPNHALATAGGGPPIVLDFSGMPAPSNPFAAARDPQWQRYLSESIHHLNDRGFRSRREP